MVVVVKRTKLWQEPAHPLLSRKYDLEKLYRLIQSNQQKIDEAFDSVSKKIGFVATTTVPISIDVDDKGKIKIAMAAENMKGTIYEEALSKAVAPILRDSAPMNPGSFEMLLFWEPALKYTLRAAVDELKLTKVPGEPQQPNEPAHYVRLRKDILDMFDSEPVMGSVLIDVIDKVYTDLKFGESIKTLTQSESMR
jgi:hypothetical protein